MKKVVFCITIIILIECSIFIGVSIYRNKNIEQNPVTNSFGEQFVGKNKASQDVRFLINRVQEFNSKLKSEDDEKVFIEGIIFVSNLKADKTYDVDVKDYYEDGNIKTIRIVESENLSVSGD